MQKKIRYTTYLTEYLIKSIKQIALDRDKKVYEIIIEALANYVFMQERLYPKH